MISYDKTIFGRDVTIWTSGIWRCKKKNLNIEKIIFKVVQMKFLAMHLLIKNYVLVFMEGNLQNIFMEHDLYLIS